MLNRETIIAAHQFRHACKEFDASKKISELDFKTIIESGWLSASSFGYEPWKFIVIQQRTMLDKIAAVSWGAAKQLEGASHYVLLLSRKSMDLLPESDYLQQTILRDTQHFNAEAITARRGKFEQFQAEDYDMLTDRTREDWAGKQSYIALANMMTSAALLGIDSCPIEGFSYPKINQLLEEYDLTEQGHFKVSVAVAFGYRKADPVRAKKRRDFDQVVAWVK